jgi:hypothetical protein
MPESLNRRDFLKAAAIAAGPSAISARGANDQAASSGHMATISFKNRKKVTWDEAAAKVCLA